MGDHRSIALYKQRNVLSFWSLCAAERMTSTDTMTDADTGLHTSIQM